MIKVTSAHLFSKGFDAAIDQPSTHCLLWEACKRTPPPPLPCAGIDVLSEGGEGGGGAGKRNDTKN